MQESWQRRRAELNHDWLKNRWIPTLSAYSRVLSGQVSDNGTLVDIQSRLSEDFIPGCGEVRQLIGCFRQEMSPRRLFAIAPLSYCDAETFSWLPEITEELWLRRHKVELVTQTALTQIDQAESAARMLLEAAEEGQASDALYRLSRDLLQICASLAKSLSQFPSAL